MSRWHKPHCKAPDISVLGGIPQCIACDSCCPLEDLISTQKGNPPLSFPPNEPRGEMNLWWPRSVPYGILKAKEDSRQLITQTSLPSRLQIKPMESNAQILEDDQSLSKKSEPVVPKGPVHLPVYKTTLGADEFRLVCLSLVGKDDDEIVHVSLETYSDVNSPEYEAVSYTWGGENGDYALCRPIFVGLYWDVVFQSQNCWDMLRFVRPWKGIRMVWVDALCINQSNIKERGAQVVKMAQIYAKCSRVIVYLGADLVSSLHYRFPSRHLLHEIESDSINPQLPDGCQLKDTRINLQEILKRNYFNRVWVIHELICSQRAIIRIGDLDFCTDSTSSAHITATKSSNWNWDSTAAPWVKYMAQKAFPVSNIYEVLRLTSQSRASDLRDRVFAVLGLVKHGDLQSQLLKPDYSLSAQHVYIGLFAHLIINLKMHHLFHYAAGLSALAPSPSWMPDWVTQESWQRIFESTPYSDWKLTEFIAKNIRKDPYNNLKRIEYRDWSFSNEWERTIFREKPWNRDVIVDINTGALSISLIHLSTISSRPALIETRGRLNIFEAEGVYPSLYLAVEGLPESVNCPGVDHLFMLVSKHTRPTYLILRELDGNGNYKLIASCEYLSVLTQRYSRFYFGVDSLYGEIEKSRSLLHRYPFEHNFHPSKIEKISNELRGFLPGKKKFWDFLPAYRAFLNEENGSDSNFETSYLSCICQEFRPHIADGFLELSFSTSAFSEVREYYWGWRSNEIFIATGQYFKNPWEWRRWQKWTPISLELPSESAFRPRIYLRAPMSAVRRIFEIMVTPIRRIQRVLGCGFDEVEALLRDGLKEEHRFIGSTEFNGSHIRFDMCWFAKGIEHANHWFRMVL